MDTSEQLDKTYTMKQNNINVSPCRDLRGNIPFGEMFRPINSKERVMDIYGYEWKKETACGWRRTIDKFFIPEGPSGPFYIHKYHSVENKERQRTARLNKLETSKIQTSKIQTSKIQTSKIQNNTMTITSISEEINNTNFAVNI